MTSRAAPSFGKKEREKSGWEKEVSPRCPKASMMVFWVIFCLRLLSGSSGWSAVAETDEWETVKVLVSKKQMEHRNGEIDERQLIEIIENGSIQSPQWSNYKDISLEKIRLKLVGWLGNELWSMEFDARNSTSSNWFDLARLTADSRNLTKDNMRLVYQQCEGAVKFKIYNTQSRSKGQGWLVAVDRGDSRGSLSNGVDISDVGFLIMMSQDISAQIFPHLHFQGNKYRGCFPAKNITSPCMDAEDITLNKCISYCSHNNRTYAGLMNRNKTCCCGNFYKPANCRKESQCDRICADEKYTNCCRNVYDVRDTGASSHVGCFDEALLRKDKETTFSPMVFDYCRQFCYHHKYLYMGLQKNHCFCSSVIWNVEKKDEQLCSFYCSGEKYKQRCGSRKPGHVSVYNTQIFLDDILEGKERRIITKSLIKQQETIDLGQRSLITGLMLNFTKLDYAETKVEISVFNSDEDCQEIHPHVLEQYPRMKLTLLADAKNYYAYRKIGPIVFRCAVVQLSSPISNTYTFALFRPEKKKLSSTISVSSATNSYTKPGSVSVTQVNSVSESERISHSESTLVNYPNAGYAFDDPNTRSSNFSISGTGSYSNSSIIDSGSTPASNANTGSYSDRSFTDPGSEPISKTGSSEKYCLCKCPDSEISATENTGFSANYKTSLGPTKDSQEKLINRLQELSDDLVIDKKTTSSYRRRKITASDNRPTAVAIGSLGISVLVIIFGSVVLLDITTLLGRY